MKGVKDLAIGNQVAGMTDQKEGKDRSERTDRVRATPGYIKPSASKNMLNASIFFHVMRIKLTNIHSRI